MMLPDKHFPPCVDLSRRGSPEKGNIKKIRRNSKTEQKNEWQVKSVLEQVKLVAQKQQDFKPK